MCCREVSVVRYAQGQRLVHWFCVTVVSSPFLLHNYNELEFALEVDCY